MLLREGSKKKILKKGGLLPNPPRTPPPGPGGQFRPSGSRIKSILIFDGCLLSVAPKVRAR